MYHFCLILELKDRTVLSIAKRHHYKGRHLETDKILKWKYAYVLF